MKFSGRKIFIKKEPSELDRFVLGFTRLLEKHTDYAVVSGYVAIILGRVRGTDDIDIIIPEKEKGDFEKMINDIIGSGYWCINTADIGEMYGLLRTGHSIRIAKEREISPNFEVKFAKTEYDFEALDKRMEASIGGKSVKIAPLELQIAYKEVVLKSEKDMEDAKHMRIVAENYIDKREIGSYRKRLKRWMLSRQNP